MAEIYRVILLGTINVGKTTLFHRIRNDVFKENVGKETLSDWCQKTLEVPDPNNGIGGTREIQIQFWDTAGLERTDSMTAHYYRNAAAALFVYSVNSGSSFQKLAKEDIPLKKCDKENKTLRIVIGSKEDLKNVVAEKDVKNFCRSVNCPFETALLLSSKSGKGVSEALVKIAEVVYKNALESEHPYKSTVNLESKTKQSKCKC